MPDLIEVTMRFEALARKHARKNPQIKKALGKLQEAIEGIYLGRLPDKRKFESMTFDMDEAFEDPEDLSKAFEAFSETCVDACQAFLRDKVSAPFVEHLRQHWSDRTCPICRSSEWVTPDCIFELREYHGGKLVLGGDSRLTAVVPVVCERCGYTHLFSGPPGQADQAPHHLATSSIAIAVLFEASGDLHPGQAQAVENDADAGKRHGAGGHHRV